MFRACPATPWLTLAEQTKQAPQSHTNGQLIFSVVASKRHEVEGASSTTQTTHEPFCETVSFSDIRDIFNPLRDLRCTGYPCFFCLCAMRIWDAHSSQFNVKVLDGETIVFGQKARHLKLFD